MEHPSDYLRSDEPLSSSLLLLTNEAVAFVLPCGVLSGQLAGFNFAEGLKDALDVVVGQVRMH